MPVAAATGINNTEGAAINRVKSAARHDVAPLMTREVGKMHFPCAS